MAIYWRKLLVLLVFLVLLSCSTSGSAFSKEQRKQQGADPAAMTVDLVVARPVGLGATILGGVVFVLSSPFSALGGNLEEAWNGLVVAPAEYTFQRPLGDFEMDKP